MATKRRSARVAEGLDESDSSILETTRAQEKEQLTGLNTRLATYIERVRQLEQENSRLAVQIRDVEVVEKKERANIAQRFDDEKRRLRMLIDDLEKREAKATIERDAAQAEHARLAARVSKLERDLAKAEDERLTAIALADEANGKARTMQVRFDKLQADIKDLNKENARLTGQLLSLQKALEDEVLQKTVAQNEQARLAEDIAFLKTQHKSAMEEVRTKRQVDMTTYQKQVSQEYNTKMQDQLAEMRAKFNEHQAASNANIENKYKAKLEDAQDLRDRALNDAAQLRARVRELEVSGSNNEVLLEAMRREIRDLKDQKKEAEETMFERLRDKDARIAELNKEISRLLAEFHNLLDNKIQLDAELNTYRVLLEGEEERLNLTGNSQSANTSVVHHASFTTGTSSAQRGVKRKRISFNGESDFDFHQLKERIQKETTGPVGLDEVDPEGNWVRVINNGDEEANLARWALVVRAGGREVTYKFNNKMKLAPGGTVSVYSAGSGHKGQLPESVTMKSQNWPIGENPSARLEDSEGDTVSTITLEASESSDPTDPSDRCTIM